MQSPYIPSVCPDSICHGVVKAAFDAGSWEALLGDESLVIPSASFVSSLYNQVSSDKIWKQMKLKGAWAKFEAARVKVTQKKISKKV